MPANLTSVEPVRKTVTAPDAASAREGYNSGWDQVIGRFTELAATAR
jgi:hypothetical protein